MQHGDALRYQHYIAQYLCSANSYMDTTPVGKNHAILALSRACDGERSPATPRHRLFISVSLCRMTYAFEFRRFRVVCSQFPDVRHACHSVKVLHPSHRPKLASQVIVELACRSGDKSLPIRRNRLQCLFWTASRKNANSAKFHFAIYAISSSNYSLPIYHYAPLSFIEGRSASSLGA